MVKTSFKLLILLIFFTCLYGCKSKKLISKKPNHYGYWFPQNIDWEYDNSDKLGNKYSQFQFYYFDSKQSSHNWATVTHEANIDSFTIAVNNSEDILRQSDKIVSMLNFTSDSTLVVDTINYLKYKNVRY